MRYAFLKDWFWACSVTSNSSIYRSTNYWDNYNKILHVLFAKSMDNDVYLEENFVYQTCWILCGTVGVNIQCVLLQMFKQVMLQVSKSLLSIQLKCSLVIGLLCFKLWCHWQAGLSNCFNHWNIYWLAVNYCHVPIFARQNSNRHNLANRTFQSSK